MGKYKQDKVVVVDLEATCWDRNQQPTDQVQEVIEIGLCFYHVDNGNITNKTSYIIKPRHSQVSEYCTQLTGITPDMVKRGMPFGDACNKMRKDFGVKNRIWASFGDSDRIGFEKNCQLYNVPYPFGRRHINIKTLFCLKHALKWETGLKKSLEIIELEFEGEHHRGHDDAFNTAKLLRHILKE